MGSYEGGFGEFELVSGSGWFDFRFRDILDVKKL